MENQLHTPADQKEGTREPSDTDSPGTDSGASQIASPRTTPASRGTLCAGQTAAKRLVKSGLPVYYSYSVTLWRLFYSERTCSLKLKLYIEGTTLNSFIREK